MSAPLPKDPVDSPNLYAYVGFDPINHWDPYGLQAKSLANGGLSWFDVWGVLADTSWGVTDGVNPDPTGTTTKGRSQFGNEGAYNVGLFLGGVTRFWVDMMMPYRRTRGR